VYFLSQNSVRLKSFSICSKKIKILYITKFYHINQSNNSGSINKYKIIRLYQQLEPWFLLSIFYYIISISTHNLCPNTSLHCEVYLHIHVCDSLWYKSELILTVHKRSGHEIYFIWYQELKLRLWMLSYADQSKRITNIDTFVQKEKHQILFH